MVSTTLQEDLLQVEGVAAAQVERGDGPGPAGVRVRLAPDADAEAVGVEVQRVLAAHGMRSRLAGDEDGPATPRPGPEEVEEHIAGDPAAEPAAAPAAVATSGPEARHPPETAPDQAVATPTGSEVAAADPPEALAGPRGRLSSLRVDETAQGVTVTATASDGRSITQRSVNTERGTFEAVVSAVGALADGSPPILLGVERTTIDDTEVVTVVVERRDGSRHAGASVVRAARPYAVAAATWAALRR